MLHRRSNLGRVEASALESFDVRGTERGRELRLLGPRLVVAAPAVVAGEVLHWCEVPVPAGREQLLTRRGARSLRELGVPGRAHPDRLREERRAIRVAEAVHRVDPVDDRDVQARVIDGVVLDRVVLLGPATARVVGRVVGAARQDRARLVVDQRPLQAGRLQGVVVPAFVVAIAVGGRRRVAELADHDLVHLPDLLLQRHPVEQVVDPAVDGRVAVQVGRLTRPGRGRRDGQHRERKRDQPAGRGEHAAHRSSSPEWSRLRPRDVVPAAAATVWRFLLVAPRFRRRASPPTPRRYRLCRFLNGRLLG